VIWVFFGCFLFVAGRFVVYSFFVFGFFFFSVIRVMGCWGLW